MKTLLVIAGPTAVGKTDFCIQLAKSLNTEVVSADSRQLYRELTIGTAKPAEADLKGIPHHFINSHSINELVSAGQFEREALHVLNCLFQKHETVILAGGTGLYINAVCFGLDDIPLPDAHIREELMQRLQEEGLKPLQEELRKIDPVYANQVDLNNWQRVIRALEVCKATGKPYSSFRQNSKQTRPFQSILCALDRPRDELYSRIDRRMDEMLKAGLVEEARSLLPYRQHNALQTVGYKEVFGYFDGEYDYSTMVDLLKRNSRRYAKRQLTWFRHQGDYHWFKADDIEGVLAWSKEHGV